MKSLRRTVRALGVILWQDAGAFVRWRLGLLLFLITTAAAMTALAPIALKLIVDAVVANGTVATPLLIGFTFLYVLALGGARALSEVNKFLYARVERRTGEIVESLTSGILGCRLILQTLVFSVLPLVAEIATIVVVMWNVGDPLFALLFCIALCGYGFRFARAARGTVAASQAAVRTDVETNATMTDAILNAETIKYFTAEKLIDARVDRVLARAEREWVSLFRHTALSGMSVASIYTTFLAITLSYAILNVTQGRGSVGTLVLISAYVMQVVRPIETIGNSLQALAQGGSQLERAVHLLALRSEDLAGGEASTLKAPASVEFEQVSFSQGGRPILEDVSFRLNAGGKLGIVGASGAGKSTIVRLLIRLFEPDGGRITLNGVPISGLSLQALRESIAVVPQDIVLFDDSLRYNIGLGRPDCSMDEIEAAARIAHLHDFIMRLPEGYETRAGERGVKLSGGERQRVAIARAALKRPSVYVFDEATSSLDSRTENDILSNLAEVSQLGTTIVIAHRLSTVVDAQEIIVVDDGRVIEKGSHESLLAMEGKYAALWHAQKGAAAASG